MVKIKRPKRLCYNYAAQLPLFNNLNNSQLMTLYLYIYLGAGYCIDLRKIEN